MPLRPPAPAIAGYLAAIDAGDVNAPPPDELIIESADLAPAGGSHFVNRMPKFFLLTPGEGPAVLPWLIV
jgi:hypothetical protein